MKIRTVLTGTSALLCHNIQLADPANYWTKLVAEISKKRKKTEDDNLELGRREFLGSLYTNEGQVVIPTANVLKCFIETGKITKEGKSVGRALSSLSGLFVPLFYKGPEKPEDLWNEEQFRDRTSVGIGKKRIIRTRPIFRVWSVMVEWELIVNVMDYDNIAKIVNLAGKVEGLGDNRVNGYGRFKAEVSEVRADVPTRRAA